MHRARAGHTAALLADGRVVIVGGNLTTGGSEGTLELFDPERQRFSRPVRLGVSPSIGEAQVLGDGRVFVPAARGGAILIGPKAGRTERTLSLSKGGTNHRLSTSSGLY
jgi:hypothetical protein